MSSRDLLLPVVCAALLVLAALPPAVGAAAAGSSGSSECTPVTVDAFRHSNSTVSELNQTGAATATTQNVDVRVEETESFVRIRAQNPNGYCVRVSVELSSEIVTPAELGNVDAVEPESSDTTADWSAMHSLEDDETYTEVTFRLSSGSPEVLFAPSKLRVESLSWTGSAEKEANSTVSKLKKSLGLAGDLQKNKYELNGTAGDITTVSLRSSDGRTVEEWHALHKTEGSEWKPVGQETDSAVFYTEDNGKVKFHYNNQSTVKFVANPGVTDKMSYEMQSYQSSIDELIDVELPFALLPAQEVLG